MGWGREAPGQVLVFTRAIFQRTFKEHFGEKSLTLQADLDAVVEMWHVARLCKAWHHAEDGTGHLTGAPGPAVRERNSHACPYFQSLGGIGQR